MKRTFWTWNLFIGVLMGLVMMLGGQGTADAITKFTRGAGDLKMYAKNQPFTVSFSVGVQSPQLKPNHKRIPATDTAGEAVTISPDAPYYDDSSGDGFLGDTAISYADAHYYDEEAIDIAVTGTATATVTKIGNYDITAAANPPDLTDGGTNATKLSGNVTVTLVDTTAGTLTITISDTTDPGDRPTDVSAAADLVFTVYIVENPTAVTATELDLLGDVTADYLAGQDDFIDPDIGVTVTGGGTAKIKYDVVSGSGQVYVTTGGRIGPKGRSITTSAAATVQLDMNGTTNKVTVTVVGSNAYVAPKTAFFIFGLPQLEATRGSSGQKGATSGRLENPLGIKVKDGPGRTISGLEVVFTSSASDARFIPVPGTTTESTGPVTTITVETDNSGVAQTYYQLGATAGPETITAAAAGVTRSDLLKATAESITSVPNIEIVSGNNQRTDKSGDLDNPLVVKVTRRGQRISGVNVTFTANRGILTNTGPTFPGTDLTSTSNVTVMDVTDGQGLASVTYLLLDHSGAVEVVASISGTSPTIYRRTVTFNINGGGTGGGGGGDDDNQPITRTISVSPSSITGAAETTQTLTVSAGTATVRVADASAFTAAGGTITGSGATRSIILPDTPGSTYTITLGASDYTDVTVPVTVTAPLANGTLEVTLGTRTGNQQPITVRAVRGGSAQSAVNITITGGATSVSRQTDSSGRASAIITLPTATSAHTLTVRATGYDPAEVTVPAVTGEPARDDSQPTTARGSAGVADSIQISGQVFRTGTVNTQLDLPLSVRVLDGNNIGVSGAKVTFRLQTGQGRLSQRGNGKAIAIKTDRSGYARAPYTPLAKGTSTVRVNAAGVTQTVTFTITVDGASDTETDTEDPTSDTTAPRTYNVRDEIPISLGDTLSFRGSQTLNGMIYTCVGSGECVVSHGTVVKGQIQASPEKTTTPGTDDTPRTTEINPVVHVNASNRPPMVWADGGTIYALVGAEVQAFISGVEGAMNIAIAGNKVYWTERTGENSGTINAANLDGSGMKELKSIMAVPMGIAVDTAANKVYWTNSRGRIQSLNADGSGRIENVRQNLPSPMDIAVARGNLYWTQYDATAGTGSVGIANPTGRGTPKYVSTGSDSPGSLVIAGNTLYWTEMTGTSAGTINSATLSGTDVKQLASIRAVPVGIAVDTARSKLFWTNSRGRVQSADLNGKKIQNVVDGLGMPGDMVLSNSIQAPVATPPSTAKSTTTAANKYDINGDGSVDSKDVDMLLLAVLSELTAAKYDVNGDGAVDAKDVRDVNKNLDKGAAGAPALLGRKFTALQRDRLQAQVDLLIATGDRSPAAMKTLIYLQQLIAMARPEKTQLLANYPNPFNPETWMPYELATDTTVKITIYNAQGVVIRTLQLGQQSAGYYTDRERAAYWDGRNAFGERVASGIYFYQLETDGMSSLRKMVILK